MVDLLQEQALLSCFLFMFLLGDIAHHYQGIVVAARQDPGLILGCAVVNR